MTKDIETTKTKYWCAKINKANTRSVFVISLFSGLIFYEAFSFGFFKSKTDFQSQYPDLLVTLIKDYSKSDICNKFVQDRIIRNLNVYSPSERGAYSLFFKPVSTTFSKKKCASGLVNCRLYAL